MKASYDARFETISAWKTSSYYDSSESWTHLFWDSGTPFRFLFDKLDPVDIVELACGHGRHVSMYQDLASTITLIDPNEENIIFCRKKFENSTFKNKITYIVNNGKELTGIEDSSKSSIFSYDSMVHFELPDIYIYLHEIYRILKPGGTALLHHSNATFDPCSTYGEKPHARNFMSAEIFSYLASRVSLSVSQQIIIPWGNIANLDCLTLLWKKEQY